MAAAAAAGNAPSDDASSMDLVYECCPLNWMVENLDLGPLPHGGGWSADGVAAMVWVATWWLCAFGVRSVCVR